MSDSKEKKCWKCKRIIVGDSRLGLCPKCFDRGGEIVAGVGAGLLTVGGIIVKVAAGKGKKS